MADINRGLHYISICCDAVDRTKNFDNEGKRSCTITSLPITTNQTLKGMVSHLIMYIAEPVLIKDNIILLISMFSQIMMLSK